MINMNLLIPEHGNLVTYFMLPLVNVNIKTFGSKFKCAYINSSGSSIYVELKAPMQTPTYNLAATYASDITINGIRIVVFNVPDYLKPDTKLFIKGAYSQMSKTAKNKIFNMSTLPYNQTMENFTVTHPVLHALSKTKRLRSFLKTYLGVVELADSGELVDPPLDNWFIEHRLTQIKNGKI